MLVHGLSQDSHMHYKPITAPQPFRQRRIRDPPRTKPLCHELAQKRLENLGIAQLLCNDAHARALLLLLILVFLRHAPKSARLDAGLHKRRDERVVVDAIAGEHDVGDGEGARGRVEFPVEGMESDSVAVVGKWLGSSLS